MDLPWHHADLGYAYLLAGNLEAADQSLRRCLQYSLECGDPQAISVAYSLLGFVHLHNGRFLEAQMHGQHGLQYSHEPNPHFPFQQAFALTVLGATALQQGEDRPAFEQLTKASDLYRKIEHVEYLGWSLPIQLIAACALRRTRRAKDLIRETAELAQKLDAYMPKLLALLATAVWCCQQNQPEMGIALWAQAEAENFVTQSRWFQAIADRFIRPLAHVIEPGTVGRSPTAGNDQGIYATHAANERMKQMVGYSGTPLVKKLGIKAGFKTVRQEPTHTTTLKR